jgi:Tol biopolymer transport system component
MDIWVMDADGTNPVQLTNDPLPEMFPAFSPDGKKIAFVRGERGPGAGMSGGPQARAKGSGLPSPGKVFGQRSSARAHTMMR